MQQRTIFDDLQTSMEDHMIKFIIGELKGRFHMASKCRISIESIEKMHIICRYIVNCVDTLSNGMYAEEACKFEKNCFVAIESTMRELEVRDIIKHHVISFFEQKYNHKL
jgi:hypothetical protein